MWRRTIATVLVMILVLTPMTGCWDKRELNELALVMAMGVDRDAQGEVRLTVQLIRPSAMNQMGGSREATYVVISATGQNVIDAIREANKKVGRKLCFSHLSMIVAGDRIARDGLKDLIDFVLRTHEVRQTTWLAITRDDVEQVLSVKTGVEDLQAAYMAGIVTTQSKLINVTATDVKGFIDKMPGEGSNPAVGVFTVVTARGINAPNNQPDVRQGLIYEKTAIFSKDQLKGYMNNEQTRGLNYILNDQKGGHVTVPALQDKKQSIVIELKKVKTSIEPALSKDKATFTVQIEAEGNVSEVGDTTDVSDLHNLEVVNREFKVSVEKEVRAAITRAQKELDVDCLGFGRALEKKYPDQWKKVKAHWLDDFPNQPYTLAVKTKIQQTNMLLKPVSTK